MDPLARPVFVVAPPQTGTLFVQRELARLRGMRELPAAGRAAIDVELRTGGPRPEGDRLTAADATPAVADRVRRRIRAALDGGVRFVDATPRNALRVPFLDALFPDATFVYLYREPRETAAGMLAAWESGEYVTRPRLPGWSGPPWSLLLVPGWRRLDSRPLTEIVVAQWAETTRTLLADLEGLAPERWSVVDFEALVADPRGELARIARFVGIEEEPVSVDTDPRAFSERPRAETMARHGEALQTALERAIGPAERARDLLAEPVSRRPTATPDADSPLRSSYTAGFAATLEAGPVSLLVSTYGTGRLVAVRYAAPRVNTLVRELPRAAGIAVSPGRLSVATATELWRYRDRRVAAQAEGVDALYVPVERRLTGAIGAREIAFAADPENDGAETEWIASSRFSCLATLDDAHSFVPRWRAPFVSAFAGDDRCHLCGLAVVDGRPGFVTALAPSDEPGGWRTRRADGGVVIDVDSNEVVAAELAHPQSPRWHDGRLYLLEADAGRLVAIAPADGSRDVVAELPGFARGLAIHRGIAYVGLSRPRHDAAKLAVAERFDELFSGVWAVDLRTGGILGYLRFDGILAEVFSIVVVPGVSFPELADPDGPAARETFVLPE